MSYITLFHSLNLDALAVLFALCTDSNIRVAAL
jgi:hypothetical protein